MLIMRRYVFVKLEVLTGVAVRYSLILRGIYTASIFRVKK
jgi:hypothetical protein